MKVVLYFIYFSLRFVVDSLISLVFPIEFDVYTNLITAFILQFYDTTIICIKTRQNKNKINMYNGKIDRY